MKIEMVRSFVDDANLRSVELENNLFTFKIIKEPKKQETA
jgi:hypothetical protein